MSRTYRSGARPRWARARRQTFRCRHCRLMVGDLPCGGRHRNHCPFCLYSRHVDAKRPGDRLSDCGGSIAPVGAFARRNGEHVIVHRCLACRVERHNRIAADDDFALVQALPLVTAQQPRRRAAADDLDLTA